LRALHASLLKHLTKTMECTSKRVTKVRVTEKMRSVSLKFRMKKQRFNEVAIQIALRSRERAFSAFGVTD